VDLGMDDNNAHVQPNGTYHYHGLPTGLIESWSPNIHSPVVGYAADGFPIYALFGHEDSSGNGPVRELTSSWRIKSGGRPESGNGPGGKYDGRFVEDYEYIDGAGDLDHNNGRFVKNQDYPDGIYAYFLTTSFPFIPRFFAGTPDESFIRHPKGGGMRQRPDGRRPPPPPGAKPPRRRN
ncbi:MAG: YHYH protein, partial [Alphaproteobacteria bacterium]|nr:YHYH protein [Alphaproteobacteria bacterium]